MMNIICIWGPSGRQEMTKNGVEHSLEINFINETILLMGAHDRAQVDKWLDNLQKAKKFYDWFTKLSNIVKE